MPSSVRAREHIVSVVVAALLVIGTGGTAWSATSSATSTANIGSTKVIPFEVTASDGTSLRGHIHKPPGDNLAIVLTLSPYWNSPLGWGPSDEVVRGYGPVLVEEGFAFAAVNLRGTGTSGGCMQYGNATDRSDARKVIQSLAAQPWSNGKVGMIGLSYDAWTQYMAIAARPPALKAAVPVSGIVDLWSWYTANGAPELFAPVFPWEWRAMYSVASDGSGGAEHSTCSEPVGDLLATSELLTTGNKTPFFVERDLRPVMKDSDVAVLTTSGTNALGDVWHHRHIDDLWRYLDPEKSRLLRGQWGHEYPAGLRGGQKFSSMVTAWFDHYLRGGPEVVSPGVFEYEDDAGRWHRSDMWPPPAKTRTRLFLSEAEMDTRRPKTESSTLFQSFPADPGSICSPASGLDHQALYVSPVVRTSSVIAGNFDLRIDLTSSQPGGNFVAILYKTPGDGSCRNLRAEGVEIGRAQLDLRHWNSPGTAQLFPVATPTRVSLRSEPLATSISAGHRLVLAVGGGSSYLAPDPMQPQLMVRTGPNHEGAIVLPVTKGTVSFLGRANDG